MKKISFWTEKKVARLTDMHQKMSSKPGAYVKIATKLGTTRAAVYNKLGRMGLLTANWSKSHKKQLKLWFLVDNQQKQEENQSG